MLKRLIPDPFLLWLVGTVLLATFLPARGGFAVVVGWLSIATVVALFFFHGAKLAREEVVAGLASWRLHLTILVITFILFPIVGIIGERLAPGLMPKDLWIGVLFVCALPSTVQSAVAFVSIARGNVPAAIASASASQLLGIFVTPVLMGVLAGTHGGGGGASGVGKVALEIFLPFAAGHLLRPWIRGFVERYKPIIGYTDRSTILIAVYSAFSAAVLEGLWHQLAPASLAVLLAVNVVLLAIALGMTFGIGRLLGFDREDRITILFCGTKKSLVQGVPMARVLFPGPEVGVILLPIMLFHQMQLMACAFLARRYANEKEA
ncbi:sodium/bile acid cotransporter 7 [Sphingomonas vulcanisoli]|uniref:Sodium/bile acid cotransporter 7 n=1 Tax=Sphingomonas vulcanisoli TaxID=1658060 RepID=A0ABX0TS80_9SPHN|nr:bile acid:sodium symporter family protein [Sphingomonas vulcanisoli]NIJ06655.1 sodium/bile acid cotransporter 7 [Sphingomonas vulcanisoli]